MKQRIFLLLLVTAVLALSTAIAMASGPNCVKVSARNYYARSVHDDSIVHAMELCLSASTKSLRYEVNPLPAISLETTDGAKMEITIVDLSHPDEVFMFLSGEKVFFWLPGVMGEKRYQMKVEVPRSSNGIIVGKLPDGQVLGQILLLNTGDAHSDTLVASVGNLSTEWWYEVESRPVGVSAYVAVITQPDEFGAFSTNYLGWRRLHDLGLERQVIVLGSDWQVGGYIAIKATFPK